MNHRNENRFGGQRAACAGLTRHERLALACAGELLCYPETSLWESLPDLRGHANALEPDVARRICAFIDVLEYRGLQSMQAEHVHTFDLNAPFSPHLAWHRYGDNPKLGRAYAALNELYRDSGFEPVSGELPDYLPKVLTFLASSPDWACTVLLDGFGTAIVTLRDRLDNAENIYASLLQAVCITLDPMLVLTNEPLSTGTLSHRAISDLARPMSCNIPTLKDRRI